MNPGRAARIPALDGLRAVAVLAVVAFHGGVLPLGQLGVDMFFAVSGYLIATILVREHQRTGTIALRAFYARRFRRLLPALWITAAGALALIGRADFSPHKTVLAVGVSLTYTMDVLWKLAPDSAMQHTWSLAVEEQFYLLFPVVLIALLRRGRPRDHTGKVVAFALGVSVLRAVVFLAIGGTNGHGFALYATRFEPIVFGVAVAFVLADADRSRFADAAVRRLTSPTAVGVAVTSLVAFQLSAIGMDQHGFPKRLFLGGFTVTALATLVLVGYVVTREASIVHRVLSWAPLVYVGKVSYGIYLFHYPALLVLRAHLTNRYTLTVTLAAVGIALAALSYELIEKRFLRPTGISIVAAPPAPPAPFPASG